MGGTRSGSTLRFGNDFTVFAKDIKVSARRYDAEDSVEFFYARKSPALDGEKRRRKKKCVAQLLKLHSRHFRSDSAFVGVRSASCYTVAGVGRNHSCLSAFQM